MIEKALTGDKRYWGWIAFLLVLIGIGTINYLRQYGYGLGLTGLSRDVAWGFYIAQLTFLVGVAASAVMVVLPYYLHDYKAFGKVTILGEFVAIGSVIMCVMFVFVDLGQPFRSLNLLLYPSPNSLLFWDTVALSGYLVLNVVISWFSMDAERKGIKPPRWLKPIIYLSIPWAISIHTVTAFLYSGLSARPFWMTAVLAPRFLASAFAAGPALLVILCLIVRNVSRFDPGDKAIKNLARIATYGMIVNVFLILMEVFTAVYSDIPEHLLHFKYMFVGIDGNSNLVPWMWLSSILAIVSLILLIPPKSRNNFKILSVGCVLLFLSLWIDKGMAMVITGFIPSPLGTITQYSPTFPELMISMGIYALGALIITILYKVAVSIRVRDLMSEIVVKRKMAAAISKSSS
ncbi:MAG: polysulfide reductase NrfD [candidate division Zixibacteria bacterium]|nr:polysulfide reductase NrfD [candidate division Zixibacteria bacterium]MBU1471290.1 polysulfide reductase NrfD [candidate division Zixibacteria bacterium]MBU2625680.1 polysulfide reductase NrfD [candidate division Zixibacteria bacterium]